MWISLFGYVGDIPYKIKDYLVGINFIVIFVGDTLHIHMTNKRQQQIILKSLNKMLSRQEYKVFSSYPNRIIYWKIDKVRFKRTGQFEVDVKITNMLTGIVKRDNETRNRLTDEFGNTLYDYVKSGTQSRTHVLYINRRVRQQTQNSVRTAFEFLSLTPWFVINKVTYPSM